MDGDIRGTIDTTLLAIENGAHVVRVTWNRQTRLERADVLQLRAMCDSVLHLHEEFERQQSNPPRVEPGDPGGN
jgi:hypothetical protein